MNINLGRFCLECVCATCQNREYCGTMQGNTDAYCHEDCKGEDGYMGECSQYNEAEE